MSLKKFSAQLHYTSSEDCQYESSFQQNPKSPEANQVLLNLVEHLAWMGVIGGQAEQLKAAFEDGFNQGVERRKQLDALKKEQNP